MDWSTLAHRHQPRAAAATGISPLTYHAVHTGMQRSVSCRLQSTNSMRGYVLAASKNPCCCHALYSGAVNAPMLLGVRPAGKRGVDDGLNVLAGEKCQQCTNRLHYSIANFEGSVYIPTPRRARADALQCVNSHGK